MGHTSPFGLAILLAGLALAENHTKESLDLPRHRKSKTLFQIRYPCTGVALEPGGETAPGRAVLARAGVEPGAPPPGSSGCPFLFLSPLGWLSSLGLDRHRFLLLLAPSWEILRHVVWL